MRHSIVGLKYDLNQMPKLILLAAVFILAFAGCSEEIDREMKVLNREMEVLKREHPPFANIKIGAIDPRLTREMVSDPIAMERVRSELEWSMRDPETLEWKALGEDTILSKILN